MNVAFVFPRPTQFEAPFFRHAATDRRHRIRVLYTDPAAARDAHDPELGSPVHWGIDLLGGYAHAIAPAGDVGAWLARELDGRDDLVVLNGYTRADLLRAALAARRAGSRTALRLDSAWIEPSRARRLARRLLFVALRSLYDRFLAVGSLGLAYLAALGVPERRRGLMPYAIDDAAFAAAATAARGERAGVRARYGLRADAPLAIAVAKLSPRETPWDLLHGLAAADPGIELLLVGDGPERPAVERFLATTHRDRVRLAGYVPYPELPMLYAAADVFVHAPREERWGVSVGEALACGLPVVAGTRVGAAADLVRDGENGRVYATGDPAALGRALDEALRLAPQRVAAATAEILPRWGYAATWQHVLAAGERS